ncbi:Cytochrome c oxidase subunit VIa superfamily [Arabidopsis suecica]|nr:Cytochrome c oxidase subunit VIa superfamily [Arabidopsis suecica]
MTYGGELYKGCCNNNIPLNSVFVPETSTNKSLNTCREKEQGRSRKMATAIVRSALSRAVTRAAPKTSVAPKRNFSSSAGHDDAYEAAKWEKITYLGIASCTALAVYVLSKGHHHGEDPPAYPHMHIRNKEFPWGPDGLFEVKHNKEH